MQGTAGWADFFSQEIHTLVKQLQTALNVVNMLESDKETAVAF